MAAEATSQLPFNPEVLAWARLRRGLSAEQAAQAINVQTDRIYAWEKGDRTPTVAQGRKLAEVYDRPFLEFFARSQPTIPSVELVPDFRLHRETPAPEEMRELTDVQAWAEEKRVNALALLKDLGEPVPELRPNLRSDISQSPEAFSRIARGAIEFSVKEQLELKSSERAELPNILRRKLEASGILVLKNTRMTKLKARGMCLYVEPLPTIVYGNEAASAQAFTLAHELGHVCLGESAISGAPVSASKNVSRASRVEEWCNKFSAAFLIPEHVLHLMITPPREVKPDFDLSILASLANRFGVSRHAMLIRLVDLRYVASDFYWKTMRPAFEREEADYRSFGRPSYYGSRYVNSHGRLYTGLVMEAWERGSISAHNAAEYMGIKNLTHLQDIRKRYWTGDA